MSYTPKLGTLTYLGAINKKSELITLKPQKCRPILPCKTSCKSYFPWCYDHRTVQRAKYAEHSHWFRSKNGRKWLMASSWKPCMLGVASKHLWTVYKWFLHSYHHHICYIAHISCSLTAFSAIFNQKTILYWIVSKNLFSFNTQYWKKIIDTLYYPHRIFLRHRTRLILRYWP